MSLPPALEQQLAAQKENVNPQQLPPVRPPPGAALITVLPTGNPKAPVHGPSRPGPSLSMSLRSGGNPGPPAPPPATTHKPLGDAAPGSGEATSLKRPMSSQGSSGKEKVSRTDGAA